MKLKATLKDWIVLILLVLFLLVITIASWNVFEERTLAFLIILSLAITLGFFIEIYRRVNVIQKAQRKLDRSYRKQEFKQLESLVSLYFTLKPKYPFPHMRGWAASPDLLQKIQEVIFQNKPSFVVEASSGISTIIIAYCLKQQGKGKVVSLEHDFKFAEITQNYLKAHDLDDIATVIYAPLKEYEIQGGQFKWYELEQLATDNPIDLLFIDGPPGSLQKLSRYPALPLLYEYLNVEAMIIVDDGKRDDETLMVERWIREFSGLSSEPLDLEKGGYLVEKGALSVSN